MSKAGTGAAIAAALACHLLASAAGAAPFTPTDADQVLERLPGTLDATARDLRPLRAAAMDHPDDPAAALPLARYYFELGQRSQDPRFIGYARAALEPWWRDLDAPTGVIVLRAAILQNRHMFAAALDDFGRVLKRDPGNAAAWAGRATVQLVQGRPHEALPSCARLERLSASIAGAICRAAAMARLGAAPGALVMLRLTLDRGSQPSKPLELWGRTELAEIARIVGDLATAEHELRAALASQPDDAFTICALADLLLDQGRPAEALDLVKGDSAHDGKLLRAAIAARRLGQPGWRNDADLLWDRFAAANVRGDALHLREEARFQLMLEDDPAAALSLAVANWRNQREAWDARLLLESALASGDQAAADGVIEWLVSTGYADARLQPLLERLGEQG